MASKWLVTGAQGFIGRYVCAHILTCHSDASVLGIGRSAKLSDSFSHTISGRHGRVLAPLPVKMLPSFASRYRYQSVDIADGSAMRGIMEDFRPEFIIHLASALKGDDPHDLARSNIEGTRVLVGILRDSNCGVSVFVVGSSGGVYGVSSRLLPICEGSSCLPADEYGASKLAAEQEACTALKGTPIRLLIARIFNVIGAGQDERHIAGKMAAQFTSVLEGCQQRVQLGSLGSTRDFIDVSDVAHALIHLARNTHASGPVNVARGQEVSMSTLLNYFRAVSGANPSIESVEGGHAAVTRQCADISRLKGLGFHCSISIEQSVQSLLRYYKEIWGNGSMPN